VARSVVAERGASARLAEAFQALVQTSASTGCCSSPTIRLRPPFGQQPEFSNLWENAKEMLTSCSDESFVGAGTRASSPYGAHAGPSKSAHQRRSADRISQWLGTVSDSSLRSLDLQLLLDLMSVERNPERWREITPPIVSTSNLLLIGDLEAADRLVQALVAEVGRGAETPTSVPPPRACSASSPDR
jgi:hypothetical protein